MPRRTDILKILIASALFVLAAGVATACSIVEIPMDVGSTLVGRLPESLIRERSSVTVSLYRVRTDPMSVGRVAPRELLVERAVAKHGSKFRFQPLPVGLYDLVVGEGGSDELVMSMRVKVQSGESDLTEDIAALLEHRRKDSEARRKARVPQRIGKLFGLVVDVTGAVVPSAKLVLAKPDSKDEVFRGETDELGRFAFDTKPGRYDLRITKLGFYTVDIPVEVTPEDSPTFQSGIGIELQVAACDPPIQPYRLHDLKKDCPAKPCPDALTKRTLTGHFMEAVPQRLKPGTERGCIGGPEGPPFQGWVARAGKGKCHGARTCRRSRVNWWGMGGQRNSRSLATLGMTIPGGGSGRQFQRRARDDRNGDGVS